jgi:hypothetical protein
MLLRNERQLVECNFILLCEFIHTLLKVADDKLSSCLLPPWAFMAYSRVILPCPVLRCVTECDESCLRCLSGYQLMGPAPTIPRGL